MITSFIKTGLLTCILFVLIGGNFAIAGFGVTPPFVRNTSLTRNSIYEQQILLVRGDPSTPLTASVVVDAPEISDWIEIVQGNSFVLPRGEQKVPMVVRVTVPKDAEFKTYTGAIRVKTREADSELNAGAVNISLGAQIDIELNVLDKIIKEFRVRKVGLTDLNEGIKIGWLYFPGKINFSMLIENTGNVDVSPSEVSLKIYDPSGKILLEETANKGSMVKITPFATENIDAQIPTHLPSGSYLARYEIKNGDNVVNKGEMNLNILPAGTLQQAGFGFVGLSLAHKMSIILPLLSLLALIILLVYTYRERKRL